MEPRAGPACSAASSALISGSIARPRWSRLSLKSPIIVVIATGATARVPELEGMDSHSVHSAWDVLTGSAGELGNVVLVIDEEYGHQGPTTAEFLLDQGKEVDLITSQETIGNFLGATTRPPLLRRLFSKKAQVFNHLEARAIRNGSLLARNIWSGEMHEVGPYESFVYAYGGCSSDSLSEPLRQHGLNVRIVGDAFAPALSAACHFGRPSVRAGNLIHPAAHAKTKSSAGGSLPLL